MTPLQSTKQSDIPDPRLIRALQEARVREIRAAELYRMLAEREKDLKRRAIFLRLADVEAGHAEQFGERITALGGIVVGAAKPAGLVDRFAAKFLGAEVMLRRMEAEEDRNIAYFNAQSA